MPSINVLKLDQHIADLLMRYDCVIVPDFGGFVANYQAAKINSNTHEFTPPGKQLSFNKNLNSNDGLLANHLIQSYGWSYDKAMEAIHVCVEVYSKDLNSGKRVLIEKVGVLYLDAEKHILFEPLNNFNFLADSFGLEKFHAVPVKEEQVVLSTPAEAPVRRLSPLRVAAAIAMPIFFIGSAFLYQEKAPENFAQQQLSSFGFSKEQPRYQIRSSESVNFEEAPLSADLEEAIKLGEERTFIIDAEIQENYYVIGGCFSEAANARSFIKSLRQKGYPAKRIDQYKELHAVAYQGFESEAAARAFLKQVKSKDNASAWLLKVKN